MWMLGCRLRETYPVVPLADRHALSIGFTTVAGGAFFGIYADRDAGPDAELLRRRHRRRAGRARGARAGQAEEEAVPVA